MIDSADPSCLWERHPLRIRNGYHRRICEALVEAHFKIRQVQTPVQCGHKRYAAPAQQRDVQPVGMAMDDVELAASCLRDVAA